jgi:hypothetical protein
LPLALRSHLRSLAPWLPAVLLLGLAAALQGWAVPQLQQQTQDDEQAALRRLKQRAGAAAADARPAWQGQLPVAAQRESRLADLLDAAARSGVQVQTVDQAPAREAAPGITQQRIDLSARGRYLDVRRFIETALLADSGLALEHLSLLRPQADAAEVDARLQLNLLQRAEGGANDAVTTTRRPWHAPSAEAVAAWSAPQPVAVAMPARVAPLPAAVAPPFVPPPPPPPRAPALAYELIGTVTDAAGAGALLAGAQHSLWVRAGDTVDSAWRVQRVEASGVDLLWLPQRLPARLNYRAP